MFLTAAEYDTPSCSEVRFGEEASLRMCPDENLRVEG